MTKRNKKGAIPATQSNVDALLSSLSETERDQLAAELADEMMVERARHQLINAPAPELATWINDHVTIENPQKSGGSKIIKFRLWQAWS